MLTVIDTQRTLAIDLCCYDLSLDPGILQNAGVSIPIIKCSSGMYEDKLFRVHAQQALAKYKKIAVYHWIDPTVSYTAQAKFLVDLLMQTGYPIAFVTLDFEQWWGDWGKWYQATTNKIPWSQVPVISGINLAVHAAGLASIVKANFPKTNVYTGMWFLNGYTPSSKVWLANYDTFISAYPHQPAAKTQMSWEQLKQYYPKAPPIGVGNIVGHQFTGDRCILPGVQELQNGYMVNSPLDVSMFDTTYLQSCGVPVTPVNTQVVVPPTVPTAPPTPPTQSFPMAVVNVDAVNIRSGPGTTYSIVGLKKLHDLVAVYETSNGYSRIGVNMWVYSQYLTPR